MTRFRWSWLEWPLYAVAALLAVWRALPAGRVVGDGVDLFGTLWHYWWLAHCFATGQDPRTTALMYHPLGKDLFAANGSNVVDAVASVPFQWLLGPVDYQPWFVVGVLLLNAATFRPLARALLSSPLAAVAATLAWQLNPYVLFELADGRITQAVLPFVPLAILSWIRCLSPDGTQRHAVLTGIFTAAQAWIYWFMGWFLAAALAWLLIWQLWRAPDRARVLGRVVVAGAVCLALVALPAAAMLGELADPGPLNPAERAGGRAHVKQAGLACTMPFTGPGPWMLDLPAVTLAIGLWLCVGPGRSRWGGLLVVMAMFSAGPFLGVGASWPALTLWPYKLASTWLPFLDRLWFPYRAMSVGMLPAALAVGFVIERIATRHVALGGVAAVAWSALLGAGLSPLSLLPLSSRSVEPPRTATWMGEQAPGAIIHLPFGLNQRTLVWQLAVPLPTLGGMGESSSIQWPRGFWSRIEAPEVRALVMGARLPGVARSWSREHAAALRDDGFRWVVFHKDLASLEIRGLEEPPDGWTDAEIDVGMAQLLAQLSDMLGPPVATEGVMVTWDLWRQAVAPPDLAATPESVSARSWVKAEPPGHVVALKEDSRDQFTRLPGLDVKEQSWTGKPKTIRRGTGKRRGPRQPSGGP